MMDIVEYIEKLDNMPRKGLSDKKAKETAYVLAKFYSETEDADKTADYLMKFDINVCQFFFEELTNNCEPENHVRAVYSAMRLTEVYKKNKNNIATSRGFAIAAVMAKKRSGHCS